MAGKLLSQIMGEYLTWKEKMNALAQSTVESYTDDLISFVNFAGERRMEEITIDTITDYRDDRFAQGYEQNTRHRSELTLKRFFTWAHKEGRYPVDDRILSANTTTRLYGVEKFVSFNEMNEMMLAPDLTKSNGIRDAAMLHLIWDCALKTSQVVALKDSEIDQKENYIVVKNSKGLRRDLPYSPKTAHLLRWYIEDVRPDWAEPYECFIFLTNRKKPMSRQGFWRCVKKYSAKEKITGQQIRNTRAAYLLEYGYTLEQIQEILGHNDIVNTRILTRSFRRQRKKGKTRSRTSGQ